jgi:hypothetical protein
VSQTGAAVEHSPEAERVRLRTYRERSRRIWRQLLLVVVVTIIIVLLSLAQRDTQAQRFERREIDRLAATLRESFHKNKAPADLLGAIPLQDPLWRRYYLNQGYARQGWAGSRIGVACSPRPVQMFLRSDGRMLLLFDGREFTVNWISEEEFRKHAAELGLALAIDDD